MGLIGILVVNILDVVQKEFDWVIENDLLLSDMVYILVLVMVYSVFGLYYWENSILQELRNGEMERVVQVEIKVSDNGKDGFVER